MPDDITIRPEPAVLKLTTGTPTISMKTNLWLNWTLIAAEHEAAALRHRAAWKAGPNRNILPEFHASLVTVVAAANAFDALHAEIAPLVGRESDPDVRGKRWAYMRQTISAACSPPRRWQNEFEWLFRELRPKAVHFEGEFHEPTWHADLQTNLAIENHLFSAEACTRAVDLLMSVWAALLTRPNVDEPRLVRWSEDRKHVLEQFEAARISSTR